MNMTFPVRRFTLLATALAAALIALSGAAQAQATVSPSQLDVPYVPTPMVVVEKMLDMAKVGRDDVVYDLGCGDGRIVITAASKRGARGIGIDLDPARIREAKANATNAGVQDRVRFVQGDLFEADFSKASVVTLYLLPRVNAKLRPQLWRQLEVGSRVVSHGFDMGDDWPPDEIAQVEGKTVYYWTIKASHKSNTRVVTARPGRPLVGDFPA